jgi:Ca-activated chloride channel family protein
MKSVSLCLSILALALALQLVAVSRSQTASAPSSGKAGALPSEQTSDTQPPVLSAVPFTVNGGKKGWKVRLPDGRPLATPAVADGKVFLGGGFGSHEFYAFDAVTGKRLWTYKTADDGPTAAIVSGRYVAFNTESCELEVITADGKPVWKKSLGDPLMSMPAVDNGKVYMAYPDRTGDRQHQLGCFDLKTGKQLWKTAIKGEVITAPVITTGRVYLATLDGTLYCLGQDDGGVLWKDAQNATSAPMVWRQRCYFSRRTELAAVQKGKPAKQQTEQVAARGLGVRADTSDLVATARRADYLDFEKRLNSPIELANQNKDASVGFGVGGVAGIGGIAGLGGGGGGGFAGLVQAKGDSKMALALKNLGQASVVGIWSYQGSKPFVYQGRLYSSMGDAVQCVDPTTEKLIWKRTFTPKQDKSNAKNLTPLLDSMLTPPAFANGKVFLGTAAGVIVCLSAKSGKILWRAELGEPISFQPAIARGRVYAATAFGGLFCLETGDAKDDGWPMWGGSPSHNGTAD